MVEEAHRAHPDPRNRGRYRRRGLRDRHRRPLVRAAFTARSASPRRRRGQRNSTPADVIAAIRELALIASDDLIAGLLNRNGLKTGHGNRWTRERVTSLRPAPSHPSVQDRRRRGRALAHPSDAARLLRRLRQRRCGWRPRLERSKLATLSRTALGSSLEPRLRGTPLKPSLNARIARPDTPQDRILAQQSLSSSRMRIDRWGGSDAGL